MRRKTAVRKNPKPKKSRMNRTPEMKLLVTRAKGSPARPGKAELGAACLRAWAMIPPKRCPEAFKYTCLSLDVSLIDDAAMAEKNQTFMRHEGPTDVLSFPIADVDHERGSFHLGDVLIGFETARREAAERRISVAEEVTRLCVHGFLHCMGYDDTTPAKRRTMFAIQEKAVLQSSSPLGGSWGIGVRGRRIR